MTGLVTGFLLLVVTQVLWGVGWAFLTGADVEWITDELDQPPSHCRFLSLIWDGRTSMGLISTMLISVPRPSPTPVFTEPT